MAGGFSHEWMCAKLTLRIAGCEVQCVHGQLSSTKAAIPSENVLDWDRLERRGCDMFKPLGKDFVGINDADDDATYVAHDNPEEAENSVDAGAAARVVEGAIIEQSE